LLPSFLLLISIYPIIILVIFIIGKIIVLIIFIIVFIIVFCSAGILYQSIFTIATTLVEHKLHEFFRTRLVQQVVAAKLLIQSSLAKIKTK